LARCVWNDRVRSRFRVELRFIVQCGGPSGLEGDCLVSSELNRGPPASLRVPSEPGVSSAIEGPRTVSSAMVPEQGVECNVWSGQGPYVRWKGPSTRWMQGMLQTRSQVQWQGQSTISSGIEGQSKISSTVEIRVDWRVIAWSQVNCTRFRVELGVPPQAFECRPSPGSRVIEGPRTVSSAILKGDPSTVSSAIVPKQGPGGC
jgi:hypothetical protein